MAAELKQEEDVARRVEGAAEGAAGQLGVLTQGMAVWAGTVTILLLVIVALIFRRLRTRATAEDCAGSELSFDAESGRSVRSSRNGDDGCSVVDVDILEQDEPAAVHYPGDKPEQRFHARPALYNPSPYRPSIPTAAAASEK